MHDQFEVTLTDDELLTELQLITDLMIAANGSVSSLSVDTIDRVLDVVHIRPRVPGELEALLPKGPLSS